MEQGDLPMVGCPFCQIASGNSRQRMITEGNYIFTALSNPRLMPGHLLIIPKRHVEKPSELTCEEKAELLETLTTLQEKILLKVATGCDIRQNCRPFLPQSKLKVNHLHFHLLPREFEDELYKKSMIYEKNIFQNLPDEEAERFKQIYAS